MELSNLSKWKSMSFLLMMSLATLNDAGKVPFDELSIEKQLLRHVRLWYNPNIPRETFKSVTPMSNLPTSLKTGDVVLCSGESNYVSDGVRMMTASPYSHVAMVYKPTYRERPLLWHSLRTASGWHEYDTGAPVDGPTLTDAQDYIHDFVSVQQDGICMVRSFQGTEKQRTHLANVIESLQLQNRGKVIYPSPWPYVFFDYSLSHAFGFTFFHPPGSSCSTTVAETLMIAGFMKSGDYDHLVKYAPADFADVQGANGGLFEEMLLQGVKYGHSQWIVDSNVIANEDDIVEMLDAGVAMDSIAANFTNSFNGISLTT